MYFEINVSKNGLHYFATAERSLTSEKEARAVAVDMQRRFPPSEGFQVSLTHYECRGKSLTVAER